MKKVKLYTMSTCPWCMKTKQFLTEHDIAFECTEYDLVSKEEQKNIVNDMRSRGGGSAFPFIIIGDEAIEGYDLARIKKCLGLEK
jgi:glutaredoxin